MTARDLETGYDGTESPLIMLVGGPGGELTRADTPRLPVTIDGTARSGRDAHHAGTSIAHICVQLKARSIGKDDNDFVG